MTSSTAGPGAGAAAGSFVFFIALGFGAGLSPFAPGTVGTLVAFPIWWAIGPYYPPLVLLGAGPLPLEQIVQLELNKVAQRLEEHAIVLNATPNALEKLANLGYDPEMGARPLRRIIQQKVEDPLSDALLSGEFEDGDTILVDLAATEDSEEIVLQRIQSQEAPPAAEALAQG